MTGVTPRHQTNWDARAAANFIGGGSGAGLLIATAIALREPLWIWQSQTIAIGLIGLGLLAVWFEIGRPWRAFNVFFHPQTSWMTREADIGVVLTAAAAAAILLNALPSLLPWAVAPATWLAALLGLAYLLCQMNIFTAAKGIPAWRHRALRPVIVATGLAEGAGLSLALLAMSGAPGIRWIIVLVILCALREVLWRRYIAQLATDGAPALAQTVLRQARVPMLLLGLILPLALSVGAFLAAEFAEPLLVAAGLAAALGGWWLKFVLVARAAFNQGFALPALPVRGAGASGRPARPGWS